MTTDKTLTLSGHGSGIGKAQTLSTGVSERQEQSQAGHRSHKANRCGFKMKVLTSLGFHQETVFAACQGTV